MATDGLDDGLPVKIQARRDCDVLDLASLSSDGFFQDGSHVPVRGIESTRFGT